jgi:Flp pilus assembly protein TadG
MHRHLLSRFIENETGNTAIITAFVLSSLVGAAGLGTDTIQWTLWKRQLQREADSAALAGALANYQGASATDAANGEIARYDYIALTAAPVIEVPPSKGPHAGDASAVRVAVQASKALPFSSFFLKTPPVIVGQATAAAIGFGTYCVVSLENTTATGITFQGNASVNLGCGMVTNSQGSTAVSAGGSSSISASPVAAVGGIPPSGNYASGTTLQPYSIAQADPFRDLPTPVLPSGGCSALNVQPNRTANITNPTGVACFSNIDIKGAAHFDPGVYYVDGGTFSAGSQANISGEGVTFILTSKNATNNPGSVATVKINGGATIDLTAPGSGPYSGVLFYQDRRASNGATNLINGNSSSRLQGAFYFASQTVEFNGTAGMNTNCLQLVAKNVVFTGNSTISNVCPSDSGTPTISGVHIRLVS